MYVERPDMTEASDYVIFRELSLDKPHEAVSRDAEFTSLVERQSSFVFRIAYSLLRNHEDADDVVQETFLRIYRSGSWGSWDDEKAYLARVAWRLALNRRLKASADAPQQDEAESQEATPERAAIESEWNRTLHKLIAALPDELRQPLVLSSIDDLNSRQIGHIMGISEGTVRTRIMRARSILKQKLATLMGGPK